MNIFRLSGDFIHLSALVILLLKIWTAQSFSDISIKSQYLFITVYVTRYLDLFVYYISLYNSLMKIFFIGISAMTLILMLILNRTTYDRQQDSFPIFLLLLPCMVLATLINHHLDLIEVMWTLSIYLEAVAIVPQLLLLYKIGEIECVTGLYLTGLGSYRALYVINWIWRYQYEGYYDIITDCAGVVQTTIYCIFLAWYLIKVRNDKEHKLVEQPSECGDGKPSVMLGMNGDACKNMYLSGTPKPSQLPTFIPAWKIKEQPDTEISKEAVEKVADKLEATLMLPQSHYDCVYSIDIGAAGDDSMKCTTDAQGNDDGTNAGAGVTNEVGGVTKA